jgi:hypothetical protein
MNRRYCEKPCRWCRASPLLLALTFKEPSSAWMAFTIAGLTGKLFSIAGWFPISTQILVVEKPPNEAASHSSTPPFLKSGSIPSSGCLLEDKFRRLLLRFDRLSQLHYAFKALAYTMINLRHFCQD